MTSGNNESAVDVQQEAERKRLAKVAKVSCSTCLSLSGSMIIAGVAKLHSGSHEKLILFKASIVLAILTFLAGLALLISVLYENVKRTFLFGLIIVAVFSVLASIVVLAVSIFI